MNAVAWMVAGSALSAALVSLPAGSARGAVWLGMFAPLLVVSISWVLIERVFRRQPERLTSVMTAAFGAKLLFFAIYVGVVVGVLRVPPVPFVASFTIYFIALHLVEALCMKRMFVSGNR